MSTLSLTDCETHVSVHLAKLTFCKWHPTSCCGDEDFQIVSYTFTIIAHSHWCLVVFTMTVWSSVVPPLQVILGHFLSQTCCVESFLHTTCTFTTHLSKRQTSLLSTKPQCACMKRFCSSPWQISAASNEAEDKWLSKSSSHFHTNLSLGEFNALDMREYWHTILSLDRF